ncbi:MAG: hypothetical protein R3F34_19230 [Planctomycetota bacterium]
MLRNQHIADHFEPLSAHSDVSEALLRALAKVGEYECRHGSHNYAAPYIVTNDTVFCAASGQSLTHWRLRPSDVEIALATGARRSELGPDWVTIELFRADWPRPDLEHWVLRAYDFARRGR